MKCPYCSTVTLKESSQGGLPLVCERCQGVWLDWEDCERLIAGTTRKFDDSPM